MVSQLSIIYLVVTFFVGINSKRYEPNWKSLDTRPIPTWYDEAKIGIYIHWGVFSVPSYGPGPAWFWHQWKRAKIPDRVEFMKKNYRPNWTYADFAEQFTAEFYDPDYWADLFKDSGAKYIMLVSKHHEGFTNWPSKYSFNWNAGDVGPKRDLVGALVNSIRNRTDIHMGIYHSLLEWFNPLYIEDGKNNWKTHNFPENKAMPELYELINTYKPDALWSDGAWEQEDTYWNSTGFLAWLYNDSPVKDKIVVNDRWGNTTSCHHGGVYNCDDKMNPGVLFKHKWENGMTINKEAWGFSRSMNLESYHTIEELLETMAETISCNGNILMNVGPTHDGRIVPIYEERLRQLGKWLKINGEAVYGSKPWTHQNDTVTPRVWYTMKKDHENLKTNAYAFVFKYPDSGVLILGAIPNTQNVTIKMLGYPDEFKYKAVKTGGISIIIPPIHWTKLPTTWAWVFKITL